MRLHARNLLLEVLNADDLVVGELTLIGHEVVIGAGKVLLQLIVEGLPGDLHAYAENDLDVHHLLLESSIQDPHVSLPWLFEWVFALVLRRHDLIQMNLVVQEVIELKAFEWLQHLLHVLLQGLYEGLVLDPQYILHQALILLLNPLLLFLQDCEEDLTLIILLLYFLCSQIDDLPQQIHAV